MTTSSRKRKMIEIALPLEDINVACKADKDRNIGTIRNLHKWFAPMPLPAWRALILAALIDDPEDDNRRLYILDLIKRLVKNNADLPDDDVVAEARSLIARQFGSELPQVFDPFCGGGSTLIEAQRLGLPAMASDLNPIPVLISRVLIELLPKVSLERAIHGQTTKASESTIELGFDDSSDHRSKGVDGVISDIQHYGSVVRERAREKLESLYPALEGESVIAWIWGRTAQCTNPTCGVETVLTTSWWLSRKPKQLAWMEPKVIDGRVEIDVVDGRADGSPPPAPKVGRGGSFTCIACEAVIPEDAITEQGLSTGLRERMLAVVSDKAGQRIYRAPSEDDILVASRVPAVELPEIRLPNIPRWFSGPRFGLLNQSDLYTNRQLFALCTFADLVRELHDEIISDGGSRDRADLITAVLCLVVGKFAQVNSSQAMIEVCAGPTRFHSGFGRNDVPMTWDFFEVSGFCEKGPNWSRLVETATSGLKYTSAGATGRVIKADARSVRAPRGLVATDPPYFDAIGYADLSDYFYFWHRRILRDVFPDLYNTVAAPKSGELTAVPAHHNGSKNAARDYFIEGFSHTFLNLRDSMSDELPMLVVYASKEQKGGRDEETRWTSILTAMVNAELEITATWPVHGTGSRRMIGMDTNAIATYIVMACRPRKERAGICSLSEFNRLLRRELPGALRDLQASSILPVDLAQAAIGPGMQIFSRFEAVVDQAGNHVNVEKALALIRAARTEVMDEQIGELDPESLFAASWWSEFGWSAGPFGHADKTARAYGIGVDDVVRAQVVTSRANKVQLVSYTELDHNWVPSSDIRPTAWEAVHHLAHRLIDRGGELEAARLMSVLGDLRDPAMALTYHLHDVAAKKGLTSDQERYNALINAWSELLKLSSDPTAAPERLF